MENLVIPPARSAFLGGLWLQFYRSLTRRYFECVWLREDEPIPNGGFVAAVTHQSSSWDSRILALWQHHHRPLRFNTHGHEETLAVVPMMRWLGAFSARGSSPQAVRGLLEFARERCEAGEAVCFFAEGLSKQNSTIVPLRRGFANVAISGELPVVPVVIRYMMRRAMRPEVFIAVGKALAPTAFVRDEAFESMAQLYQRIELDIINDIVEQRYQIMLKGGKTWFQRATLLVAPVLLNLSRLSSRHDPIKVEAPQSESTSRT